MAAVMAVAPGPLIGAVVLGAGTRERCQVAAGVGLIQHGPHQLARHHHHQPDADKRERH